MFAATPLGTMSGFNLSVSGSGIVEFKADGTYHYEPNFQLSVTVADQTGGGSWGGTLDGTWKTDGAILTMAQTQNNVTGSITLMGRTQPFPMNQTFNGSATITDCQPATLTYELDTPAGKMSQTLVTV